MVKTTLRPLYPPKSDPVPIVDSWVGSRAGLDTYGKENIYWLNGGSNLARVERRESITVAGLTLTF